MPAPGQAPDGSMPPEGMQPPAAMSPEEQAMMAQDALPSGINIPEEFGEAPLTPEQNLDLLK